MGIFADLEKALAFDSQDIEGVVRDIELLKEDFARKIEQQLPIWGQAIYDAVLGSQRVPEVLSAWRSATGQAARRFTVFVDSQLAEGAAADQQRLANEAATLLLSLPLELLNDGKGYLFHGAKPVLVRRRLPYRRSLEGTVAEPPIRILLVSPRPEDERAGYIDHRVSALPLVAALETLGELAELTVLAPPTFPALSAKVQRAREADIGQAGISQCNSNCEKTANCRCIGNCPILRPGRGRYGARFNRNGLPAPGRG